MTGRDIVSLGGIAHRNIRRAGTGSERPRPAPARNGAPAAPQHPSGAPWSATTHGRVRLTGCYEISSDSTACTWWTGSSVDAFGAEVMADGGD